MDYFDFLVISWFVVGGFCRELCVRLLGSLIGLVRGLLILVRRLKGGESRNHLEVDLRVVRKKFWEV